MVFITSNGIRKDYFLPDIYLQSFSDLYIGILRFDPLKGLMRSIKDLLEGLIFIITINRGMIPVSGQPLLLEDIADQSIALVNPIE